MTQYVDKAALVAEIERRIREYKNEYNRANQFVTFGKIKGLEEVLSFLDSLEVKEGKQIIVITESDGSAHIHWDCRSLEDVNTLLGCAKLFITDRQIEDVREKGSFSDYNTEEGRYKDLFAKTLKVKEADLDKTLTGFMSRYAYENDGEYPSAIEIAKHFFELGQLNAKKEE